MNRLFKTNIERLTEKLGIIETELGSLLDISGISTRPSRSGEFYIGNPHNWYSPTDTQKRIQLSLLPKYLEWKEGFDVLFNQIPPDLARQIKEIDESLKDYIVQPNNNGHSGYTPGSILTAKNILAKYVDQLIRILNLHKKTDEEYIVIPDVNSLLIFNDWTDYQGLLSQKKLLVVLTPTVLGELDELKINHRNPEVRDKAKTIIRRIKGLRQQGSLNDGVTNNQTIKIKAIAKEPNFSKTFQWLDSTNNDDRIIASAVEIQKDYPSDYVIIVTADINLQNKAELCYLNYSDPDI